MQGYAQETCRTRFFVGLRIEVDAPGVLAAIRPCRWWQRAVLAADGSTRMIEICYLNYVIMVICNISWKWFGRQKILCSMSVGAISWGSASGRTIQLAEFTLFCLFSAIMRRQILFLFQHLWVANMGTERVFRCVLAWSHLYMRVCSSDRPWVRPWVHEWVRNAFLDASSHLYMRVLVRPSICPSVCPWVNCFFSNVWNDENWGKVMK